MIAGLTPRQLDTAWRRHAECRQSYTALGSSMCTMNLRVYQHDSMINYSESLLGWFSLQLPGYSMSWHIMAKLPSNHSFESLIVAFQSRFWVLDWVWGWDSKVGLSIAIELVPGSFLAASRSWFNSLFCLWMSLVLTDDSLIIGSPLSANSPLQWFEPGGSGCILWYSPTNPDSWLW